MITLFSFFVKYFVALYLTIINILLFEILYFVLTLDSAASCAYGDSPSDAPMLLLTAAPNLIDPKKKLLRRLPQARVLHWHTEDKA